MVSFSISSMFYDTLQKPKASKNQELWLDMQTDTIGKELYCCLNFLAGLLIFGWLIARVISAAPAF